MSTVPSPESIEAFLGGITLQVHYRNGQTETLRVRELPISAVPLYAAALTEEDRAAELFCDKPKGWAESITRESLVEIIEKGEELNLPFTVGWMQRKARRDLKVAQSLGADVSSLVARVAEQLASRSGDGSQTSPLPAGTPQPH